MGAVLQDVQQGVVGERGVQVGVLRETVGPLGAIA